MEEITEEMGKREQASRDMQDNRDLQSRHGEPGSAGQEFPSYIRAELLTQTGNTREERIREIRRKVFMHFPDEDLGTIKRYVDFITVAPEEGWNLRQQVALASYNFRPFEMLEEIVSFLK